MVTLAPQRVQSLYVHVPFCAQKCHYCAFYSEASNGELVHRFVDCLIRELEMVAHDLQPRTIFFGGGTPSILNLGQWERILSAFHRLGLTAASEWTVECNPATVSLDKARLLKRAGVNRLSLGVQSLDEALLDRLGRIHSRDMALRSFDLLRRAGFANLNVDLMFAIPGQTLQSWRNTLAEALALESEHISSYEVIYEEDTALYQQLQAGQIQENEDLACEMYETLVDAAIRAGLKQYEVANFARDLTRDGIEGSASPFYACQHNVNYWRGGSFYGLGPSATSYVRGVRSKNWSNTQLYCDQIEKGRRAIESSECLSPQARAGETAAFGIRMTQGWRFEEFLGITGFDLRKDWATELETLKHQGLAILESEGFRLSAKGLRFADSAAQCFLR